MLRARLPRPRENPVPEPICREGALEVIAGSCSLKWGVALPGTGVETAERLQIPGGAARPPGGRGVRKRNAKGAGVSEGLGADARAAGAGGGPGADRGRGRGGGLGVRTLGSGGLGAARGEEPGQRSAGIRLPSGSDPPAGAVRQESRWVAGLRVPASGVVKPGRGGRPPWSSF